jgi:uncharacterized protein (TIRG00374 family)
MTAEKLWRLAIGLAFSAGLLWLLLRGVEVAKLVALLSGVYWPGLLAALMALFGSYAARIRRWQILLRHENPALTWRQCAGPLLAGFAVNNVLPFRAGDMLRCVGFCGLLRVSAGGAGVTLVVERLLDLITLLLILAIVSVAFGFDGLRLFGLGAMGVAVLMAAVLLLPQLFGPALRGLLWVIDRLSSRLGKRFRSECARASELLEAARSRRTMLSLAGWSLAVWAAEGVVFSFAAHSLLALEAPIFAWLALPAATLGTLLPGLPGHVGTFDYFAAEAIAAGGNSVLASAAFALLVHVLLWLPVTAAGGLWLWMRRE